ncbi:ABC transporter permease [Cryptosporangium arvum]|uniref:Transport permease protein n=1 Tax=Cryptosporangium arvum DSM 44712 TaxID=927661 RepID=A0A010Z1I7_9ACTN|nr:ABC transporter permease [Cryptosporangium arvum]EXG81263.1 ABC-type multidrug transport system, permease component [Cryptosporangium arvum DSM 44712]
MIKTLVKTEFRLLLREPILLLWTTGLPIIAFTVLALVPGTSRPTDSLGGLSYAQVYLGVIALIALALLTTMSLPAVLGSYRERGILKRLSVTPMRPWRLLATQIGINLAVVLSTVAVMLIVATLTFDDGFPGNPLGWLITYLLAAGSLLGLAALVAALAPSSKVANAITSILFFPLMFFAGLWIPLQTMPGWLRTISEFTPLGAASQALATSIDGDFPAVKSLLVLLAYAVVFIGLAVRTFRWQ